jgi:hypothetical protein
MLGQTLRVTWADTGKPPSRVLITQYAVSRLGPWRSQYHLPLPLDPPDPETMLLLVRVMAWAEITRGQPADKWPDFWAWAASVDSIEPDSDATETRPTNRGNGDTP